MAAGEWKEAHSLFLQVASITVAVAATSWLFVYTAMLMLAPRLELARGLSAAEVRAVASLAGTVAIARSPASAVRSLVRA